MWLQADELMARLTDVVESTVEEYTPQGDTEQEQAFDQMSVALLRALKSGEGLAGRTERKFSGAQ